MLRKHLSLRKPQTLYEEGPDSVFLLASERPGEALQIVTFIGHHFEFTGEWQWRPVAMGIALQARLLRLANRHDWPAKRCNNLRLIRLSLSRRKKLRLLAKSTLPAGYCSRGPITKKHAQPWPDASDSVHFRRVGSLRQDHARSCSNRGNRTTNHRRNEQSRKFALFIFVTWIRRVT